MLANTTINKELNKHPEIQKSLVDQIEHKREKEARKIVAQEIRDLETGATIAHGNSYLFDETNRERIETKIQRDKQPIDYLIEFPEAIEKIMYLGTGHKLTEDETYYDPNHVDNTKKHRLDMLKGATKNEIKKLINDLEILGDLIDSFLSEIDKTLPDKE